MYGYRVYFTERSKNRVMRWDPDTGASTPVSIDGLNGPYGLTLNGQGQVLVADKLNHRIMPALSGAVPLFYRDSDNHRLTRFPAIKDAPRAPTGIFFSSRTGTILVAFSDDGTIYRIHPDGRLELVVGIPPGRPFMYVACRESFAREEIINAPVKMPTAVVERADGTVIFIERGYQVVREYHPGRGMRSIFSLPQAGVRYLSREVVQCGPDDLRLNAYWPAHPSALAVDNGDRLFFADAVHRRIWLIDTKTGMMHTVATTGALNDRESGGPAALTVGADGTLWVLDYGLGSVLGYRESKSGWIQVPESIATIHSKLTCVSNEGAGIVCGP